jgi:hypothetical protein
MESSVRISQPKKNALQIRFLRLQMIAAPADRRRLQSNRANSFLNITFEV